MENSSPNEIDSDPLLLRR